MLLIKLGKWVFYPRTQIIEGVRAYNNPSRYVNEDNKNVYFPYSSDVAPDLTWKVINNEANEVIHNVATLGRTQGERGILLSEQSIYTIATDTRSGGEYVVGTRQRLNFSVVAIAPTELSGYMYGVCYASYIGTMSDVVDSIHECIEWEDIPEETKDKIVRWINNVTKIFNERSMYTIDGYNIYNRTKHLALGCNIKECLTTAEKGAIVIDDKPIKSMEEVRLSFLEKQEKEKEEAKKAKSKSKSTKRKTQTNKE